MRSGTLKTLLIIILLSINLYFVFTISSLKSAKTYFDHEEIKEAVEVVREKGVNIDAQKVIKEKEVPKVVRLSFDKTASDALAKKTMQGEYGTFSIPNGQRFANDTESLSFSFDYSFEYTRAGTTVTAEKIEEKLSEAKNLDTSLSKEFSDTFSELFDGFSLGDSTLSLVVKKTLKDGDTVYIEAVEYVGGLEIEGARIVAAVKGKSAVFAAGKLYFSKASQEYRADALDGINILFELEKNGAEIDKMEMIYLPVSDKEYNFYLTPTYKFTYADASVSLYDAVSGKKR